MRAILRTAAVAPALVAAGCGGSGPPDDPAAIVDTTAVDMVPHYRFEPAAIRVTEGATVTWRNRDDFTHSVRIESSSEDPRVAGPGEAIRITLDEPGDYAYVCTFHPHDMRGRIIVAER